MAVIVTHPSPFVEAKITLAVPTADISTTQSAEGLIIHVKATAAGLVAINDVLVQITALRDAVQALVP